MDIFPRDLLMAARDARGRLSDAATTTAQMGAKAQGSSSMAAAAQHAIFADALLGAMRARLEALRTVVK